jgi:hypothetical protein
MMEIWLATRILLILCDMMRNLARNKYAASLYLEKYGSYEILTIAWNVFLEMWSELEIRNPFAENMKKLVRDKDPPDPVL